MTKKIAVQMGAGKIGRGFIGAVLEKSGYHVVFADVARPIIDAINSEKKYSIHIADVNSREIEISDISAVDSTMPEAAEKIATANLVTTAVGFALLPKIAAVIAKGLVLREKNGVRKPLDIIACENGLDATSILKTEVFRRLDPVTASYAEKKVGFANCSVDRIVPPIRCENPIDVSVEDFFEWNVDKNALKGDLSDIKGMNLVENPEAYVQRKLFTLNTGHAISAYIGRLKGFATIAEAIENPKVRAIAEGAMEESGKALIKKFGFDPKAHADYIKKVLVRFKNPYLKDDVSRVGHDPMRKLSKKDRLVGPLLLAREYGIPTPNLLLGIAAALRYDNSDDPQSIQIIEGIKNDGVSKTFSKVSGVEDSSLLKEVADAYKTLPSKIK